MSVISVVVAALGVAVSTRVEKFTNDIGTTMKTERAEKTAVLGKARKSRFFLSTCSCESNAIS